MISTVKKTFFKIKETIDHFREIYLPCTVYDARLNFSYTLRTTPVNLKAN